MNLETENNDDQKHKIHLIEEAVNEYYTALDNRENAITAQNKAFSKIESILNMEWKQNASCAKNK